MKVVKVQFVPWDKSYYFSDNGITLGMGNRVIVKTDMGTEMGRVVGFREVKDEEELFKEENDDNVLEEKDEKTEEKKEEIDESASVRQLADSDVMKKELKPIIRKANASDINKMASAEEREDAVEFCRQAKDRYNLPMKVIDAYFAYDGSKITFAFIADGRVDFRELVKELTRHFGRTIRLQQIGIRDEAKVMGDYGHCGRGLCCRGHLDKLVSITSEMADLQQCSHRGLDRISGVCGRLMCCLAYEEGGYEEMAAKMPKIGTRVNVDGKKGEVVGLNVLKRSVNVLFPGEKEEDGGTVVEVDLDRKKNRD